MPSRLLVLLFWTTYTSAAAPVGWLLSTYYTDSACTAVTGYATAFGVGECIADKSGGSHVDTPTTTASSVSLTAVYYSDSSCTTTNGNTLTWLPVTSLITCIQGGTLYQKLAYTTTQPDFAASDVVLTWFTSPTICKSSPSTSSSLIESYVKDKCVKQSDTSSAKVTISGNSGSLRIYSDSSCSSQKSSSDIGPVSCTTENVVGDGTTNRKTALTISGKFSNAGGGVVGTIIGIILLLCCCSSIGGCVWWFCIRRNSPIAVTDPGPGQGVYTAPAGHAPQMIAGAYYVSPQDPQHQQHQQPFYPQQEGGVQMMTTMGGGLYHQPMQQQQQQQQQYGMQMAPQDGGFPVQSFYPPQQQQLMPYDAHTVPVAVAMIPVAQDQQHHVPMVIAHVEPKS